MSNYDALTPKQQGAIEALLCEKDVTAAAEKIGVSRRTLQRWMSEEAFQQCLNAATSQQIDAAVRRLAKMTNKALDTLEAIMDSVVLGKGAGAKVRAATVVIEQLVKLRQLNDIERRLSALEGVTHV